MQIKIRFVGLFLDDSEEKITDLHTTDQSLREPSAFPQLLALMDKVSRHTKLMEYGFGIVNQAMTSMSW